ncbi:hypothetical protein ACO0LC_26715 [Undibacterium sp. JH2W]|uniref:hypothetical protein n=1 Tax=Undibacterium sp. JH2W TaxID=3413037 RepID=UPI003BF3630C
MSLFYTRRQERYAKEGDPGVAAPAGFPFVQYKKWEDPKLASLRQRLFLIHFLCCTNGSYTWEQLKIKSNRNFKKQRQYNRCANC